MTLVATAGELRATASEGEPPAPRRGRGRPRTRPAGAAGRHLWRADLQAERDEQHVVDAIRREVERHG